MSSNQSAEKEQLFEAQLKRENERLVSAQAQLEEARVLYEQLNAKQETARKLEQISVQMAELAHQSPLWAESPFTGEPLRDGDAVNQHYAGFIERMDRQIGQYKTQFKDAKQNFDSAQKAVTDIRAQIRELTAELEKLRPMIRTRTVTRIDASGVERSYTVVFRRQVIMPWNESPTDQRRYQRIRNLVVLLFLLLSLILPFIPVPEPEKTFEIPERMAQLIQEKKPPPPPPVVAEKKEEPKEEPEKEKLKPRKEAPPADTELAKAAREKAQRSGLLAFSDSFADLMDNSAEQKLGKQARVTSGGETARQTERSIITSSARQGSGGINTAGLSRDVAGSGLSGRGTSRVTGVITDEFGDADRPLSDSIKGSRTDEEIQLVFDRNKSALYALYQRALRNDPTLKGKVVLKITIASSGEVLAASIESSDLKDIDLERKIAARVKLFNFGPKDVGTITITYPIDFLPA